MHTSRILHLSVIILLITLFTQNPVFSEEAQNYYNRIKKLTTEKQFKPALELSAKAMKEYPYEQGFAAYSIWCSNELKQFDEAIALGRRALKKWPDSPNIKENYSWSLVLYTQDIIENKKGIDPLPFAREGFELNPNESSMLWLAISLRHNGNLDDAIDLFKEGAEKYPGNRYFSLNLLYIHIERGQKARENNKRKYADEQFALAYKIDPANEASLMWYGISMRDNKKYFEAVKLFSEGKRLYPSNKYFSENLKWTYVDWGSQFTENNEIDKARDILNKAKKSFPNDPFITSSLSFTYFRRDHKKWEALSIESLKLLPKEKLKTDNVYQVPLLSGRILIHQGNLEPVTHHGISTAFAWDFVIVDENNSYGKSWNRKEDHLIFSQPVYAARDGIIHKVFDSSPDTEPGKNEPYETNHILIRHSDGELSYYAHLKKGSVIVKEGDTVKKGDGIAVVGSSGKYVDFPHLHFQVMRDNVCVETRLSGFELYSKGVWKNPGPVIPKKNEILRSVWSR